MVRRTLAFFFLGALSGCSDGGPTAVNIILADTNRDGVIDDKDGPGHAAWSATGGAIFLANLDDDDVDGKADGADAVVNGASDANDLARIKIAPSPNLDSAATGTVTVEGKNVDGKTHLFRKDGESWSIASALSGADLKSGIELGLEATEFVSVIDDSKWDGYAVVHLVVNDSTGKNLVDDSVKLRVAPFVMINNLSDLSTVWASPVGDEGGDAFFSDLSALAMASSTSAMDSMADEQWAEDYWQFGHTFMPGPNNTTQGMVVVQRSAQPDRTAGEVAAPMLGPDVAFIWPHTDSLHGQTDSKGNSMDSFGDHDTIPPYTKGADEYPLGRIFIGGNMTSHIDPVVRAFYDAQLAQTVFQVDTTFLLVGHVDEIFSFVPANTPRGWKLLVASPRLARTFLQSLVDAGQGGAMMFPGQFWLDANNNQIPADVTITALLADSEIMAASQQAQTNIDTALAALKAEVGLADDEIVELPILFERQIGDSGGYEDVAHMVGTVNMRVLNGNAGIAAPHGAMIGGVDVLEKDLTDRLASAQNHLGSDGNGLKITFVEDWDDYHVEDGEVHCGSTSVVKPIANIQWWGAGR